MARILIVDDQLDHCEPLRRAIEFFGHTAWCLAGSEGALQFMLRESIDLLILDVMMPGIDGIELLRMLRRTPVSKHLPVIMFSALADPHFQRYAIDKGANDYWVKGSMTFEAIEQRLCKYLP